MHQVQELCGPDDEPCRCPRCSYSYVETSNTKAVAAVVYGLVALLMCYLVSRTDEVASFSLLLTALFAFFYFGMSQIDLWQRRNGA